MNQSHSIEIPQDWLTRLRTPVPKRALTYGDALVMGRHQAARLRAILQVKETAMPLGWVADVPNVDLQVLPAYQVEELAGGPASGFTKRQPNGRYLVVVNKNTSHAHRRFTLAHELRHLIDYPYADTLYSRLGFGDSERQESQIELLCHDFAAHLLMPTTLVKKAWTLGFQEVTALAGMFKVSADAMTVRLRNIGLLDDDQRPTAMYFRRVVLPGDLASLVA